MRLSTGRFVSGDDFFDRVAELGVLESHVRDRNHVLLSGQRRMGKTSIVRELGRRLQNDGWSFLFADVEGADCPEDLVAALAEATHPIRSISSRVAAAMQRLFAENVEEISAHEFRLKFRAGLDAGSWRHYGDQLFRECADDEPVLLAIDELPIFLKRLHRRDGNARRVDDVLSWLRRVVQQLGERSPVLITSGSIGLEPFVQRLGLPDRINYLYSFRLGPWSAATCEGCFSRLAERYELQVDDGVALAVHERLGVGIPHLVQSFFARLRDFAVFQGRNRLGVGDVDEVYRTAFMGPAGQSDIVHYDTRLQDALERDGYTVAMEILGEAATQDVFTPEAQRSLERQYAGKIEDVLGCVSGVLDVLVHDGYLEHDDGDYRFLLHPLKDWWSGRFRDHHVPLRERRTDDDAEES